METGGWTCVKETASFVVGPGFGCEACEDFGEIREDSDSMEKYLHCC
jgi:hypothetical protein